MYKGLFYFEEIAADGGGLDVRGRTGFMLSGVI